MVTRKFQALLKNTLTLILAGGAGERLYPLTKLRAKPAVSFGGIYRIIDFTLSNCLNSSLRKIYLLTQYGSLSLDQHIRHGWNIFNTDLDEFIYLVPPQQRYVNRWYLGTADAVYQNIHLLESERPEHVLILSGDHIYKMDYYDMLAYHVDTGADMTLGAVEFSVEEAHRFGVVEVDADRRVVGFREKPKDPPALPGDPSRSFVNMGVYAFKTEALVKAVIRDAKENTDHDFGKNVIPDMVKDGFPVYAYNFRDENKKEAKYWRDIGTLDSYYEASMDLVQVNPLFNLYDRDWPIRTYMKPYPPAKTVFNDGDRTGLALNSILSEGCIISGGRVERCILSPSVRVRSYAHVQDSILMEGVEVGRHCRIRRAIIDEGVQISQGTEIGFDVEKDRRQFVLSEGGIVVVPSGMQFP